MRGRAQRSVPARRLRRIGPVMWRAAAWVPLLALVVGGGAWLAASRTPEGEAMLTAAEARIVAASGAIGLVVNDIEVEGRTTTDKATIVAALGAERGTPILAVSPSRAQRQLESLPWVRSAAIERRLPGTLFVRLVERHPLAVWQHDGRQELIDDQGEVIPVGDLSRFARLPTIVGANAPAHAAALIAMLASEPALAARVTAAVRVDDRRWNLRLDNAIEVLLPEEEAAAAWTRLAELERTKQLLQRDIRSIDLRLPDRLVLRVAAPAAPPAKEAAPAKKPQQQPQPPHAPGKTT